MTTPLNAGLAGTWLEYRSDAGSLIAQTKTLLYIFRDMLWAIGLVLKARNDLEGVSGNPDRWIHPWNNIK